MVSAIFKLSLWNLFSLKCFSLHAEARQNDKLIIISSSYPIGTGVLTLQVKEPGHEAYPLTSI
jgi:hypothetical protein